ncbi:uncharacterized protein TNCV_1049101 [Trichonephila clavipes]|nr:uncharacterized protein TNCV_1049101 [Trichonephila clavipes]
MSYDYTACKRSLECLFGLGHLVRIKILAQIRIVGTQVPPSTKETGCQNYLRWLVSALYGAALRRDVAAVADWYRHRIVAGFVTSSSPVPLKTRRVGQRCTLNLSRAEMSSRWCGVVVRRGVPAQVSSTSLDHGSNYVVRRQKPSCS